MNREHVISDELLEQAQLAFFRNEHWIAYNTVPYFLDKGDMYFFKTPDEAHEFSDNNISEYDQYRVFHAYSVDEVLKQIPYGERLEKQLADPDSNGLYNKDGTAFTDALIEHIEQQQILNNKNLSTMNEKNFDYLSKQLKYTGFGEELLEQLKEKMKTQEPQFMLIMQKDYGKDQTVATLHFRKSEESDMYFFNRYNLALKNERHIDPVKQTFFIGNKDANITLKEAYNLLCGRAIHKSLTTKEGEKYNAWLQINFKETEAKGNYKMKQFHEKYDYNINSVLSSYPIRELTDNQQKERLVESLERGNRQSVTMELGGKEIKVFIEASPQFKSLNLYDADMKRVTRQTLAEKNGEAQSMEKNARQKQTNSVADDGDSPVESPKKAKRKKQSIS